MLYCNIELHYFEIRVCSCINASRIHIDPKAIGYHIVFHVTQKQYGNLSKTAHFVAIKNLKEFLREQKLYSNRVGWCDGAG